MLLKGKPKGLVAALTLGSGGFDALRFSNAVQIVVLCNMHDRPSRNKFALRAR